MPSTRREAARELAEALLDDLELARIAPMDIARRSLRLARLLDDVDAVTWLGFEVNGYSSGSQKEASVAAVRSGRVTVGPVERNRIGDESVPATGETYWTMSLGQASIATEHSTAVQAAQTPAERNIVRQDAMLMQGVIDRIVGSMHRYVLEKSVELRFGDTVEDALGTLRSRVDASIAELAPKAATKLASAFENASSGSAEDWANAAGACRRIIKEVADSLRPPGPKVNGREMTDAAYVNRLVDWIQSQGVGDTLKAVISSDLDDFGNRLDALTNAGHKGAHAEVTKYEASRALTGTYLLVGDILDLRDLAAEASKGAAVEASSPAAEEAAGDD